MVLAGSSGAETSASRATVFRSGATPSSRSSTTASAAAAALPYRSGRSAGEDSSAGPSTAIHRCQVHEHRPHGDHDDLVPLVAPGVLEDDDALARPAPRRTGRA